MGNRTYKTAYNYVNRNYNQEKVVVWHVISVDGGDYANKTTIANWYPVCGDSRLSLTLDEAVTIDQLIEGAHLPQHDEACCRCLKTLRAKGTPEDNYQQYLRRKRKKQRWRASVISSYLQKCPSCAGIMQKQETLLGDYRTLCKECSRSWNFDVTVLSNRSFRIWGYSSHEEDYQQSGRVP